MYEVKLTEPFKKDIRELMVEDRPTAIYLVTLLQAIEEDERLLRKLHSTILQRNIPYPEFDITTWGELIRSYGLSIWRLKPKGENSYNAKSYRVIYTFDARTDTMYLLGLMERSNGYDNTNTDFTQRIIKQYNDHGFYTLKLH